MTRVLLTGATGFLGSHIAEVLVQQGLSLRCTLRQTSSLKWLAHLDTENRIVDFSDEPSLQKACEGIDVIVHNAGLTRARDELEFFEVNTYSTERLAQAAIRAGVSRFIYISSLEARGPDGFTTAVSAYGKSKLAAEQLLRSLSGDIEVVLLRPAGVYGPRDTDLLSLFRLANYGFLPVPATRARLQPVHGRDVAEAVWASIRSRAVPGPFAISAPQTYSWQEMAQLIETSLNRRLSVIHIPKEIFLGVAYTSEVVAKLLKQAPKLDRRRAKSLAYYSYTCDTTAFRDAFDWQAGITLADGLRETAVWYKKQGWL